MCVWACGRGICVRACEYGCSSVRAFRLCVHALCVKANEHTLAREPVYAYKHLALAPTHTHSDTTQTPTQVSTQQLAPIVNTVLHPVPPYVSLGVLAFSWIRFLRSPSPFLYLRIAAMISSLRCLPPLPPHFAYVAFSSFPSTFPPPSPPYDWNMQHAKGQEGPGPCPCPCPCPGSSPRPHAPCPVR